MNDKLHHKIDKLREEKLILKSSLNNSKEEIKFRDHQIKKIENELSITQKEYLDLVNKHYETQNRNHDSSRSNTKNIEIFEKENILSTEALALKQENQNLKNENSFLRRTIENLQNDLELKYIPKAETLKKITQLESESNYYMSKLKISEGNIDQIKRQMKSISIDNDELKKELQESEKRYGEFRNSIRVECFDTDLANRETPLNLICEDIEGDPQEEAFVKPRATFTKLPRQSQLDDVTRFSVQENEDGATAHEDPEEVQIFIG